MKTLHALALAAGLALCAGCDDEKTTPDAAVTNPDGGGTTADGGTMTTPDGGGTMTTPDGSGTAAPPDGGMAAATLVDFVTGLVKNSTNGTATPVTVDDKTLADPMDPAAFNALLGL